MGGVSGVWACEAVVESGELFGVQEEVEGGGDAARYSCVVVSVMPCPTINPARAPSKAYDPW